MFHAEGGHRVATQELLGLHIDLSVRRVAPMPTELYAGILALVREHAGKPLPRGVGRRISMPGKQAD